MYGVAADLVIRLFLPILSFHILALLTTNPLNPRTLYYDGGTLFDWEVDQAVFADR